VQLSEVVGLRRTASVAIDGTVDDHAPTVLLLEALWGRLAVLPASSAFRVAEQPQQDVSDDPLA
jgi:hypothetical protein